jgi:hypothetical protein
MSGASFGSICQAVTSDAADVARGWMDERAGSAMFKLSLTECFIAAGQVCMVIVAALLR